MSQPMQPPAYPVPPTPYPSPVAPTVDLRAWLAAGVAGIAGGYAVVAAVAGQLPLLLSGRGGLPPSAAVIPVAQLVFGAAVVAVAYLLAPGPLGMRLVGIGVFAAGAVVAAALGTMRLSGELPLRGALSVYLVNAYVLVLLAGALGWLLAARARGLAYLTLIGTAFVALVPWILVRSGVSSVLSTTATLAGSLVLALGVLAASWPRSTR